ncbi:DUF3221 domain-containing protein [Sporosarcina sp. Marseille-Q4063]|uniref:DUF3221 domain-containing protein n=1 Tax=Sporosarcina sp. Marseille-Q4063 TaxID=2810514 RepID=UPI001BB0066D|nr:DUF3221 domain-containing protein [Sporosarcina sp. Marseille-Q4063]QUW23262.1 DUF3221 domain-containing protein [Sporosarcina sp. Marseille-Q4063]
MVTNPTYKRLIIFVLIPLALLVIINGLTSKDRTSIDQAEIPESAGVIEGHVVSKRMSYLWVADEPVSIWRRLTGFVTEDYGQGRIMVYRHPDAEKNVLNGLRINQKVRVYCDHIKESNPPKTSAYYVEVVNDE